MNRSLCIASLLVLASVGSTAFAQSTSLPPDLDAKSLARLPYVTRQDLGEAGQKLADIFARNGKPSDPITGPLAFASYNVPVANALLDLHDGAVGKRLAVPPGVSLDDLPGSLRTGDGQNLAGIQADRLRILSKWQGWLERIHNTGTRRRQA